MQTPQGVQPTGTNAPKGLSKSESTRRTGQPAGGRACGRFRKRELPSYVQVPEKAGGSLAATDERAPSAERDAGGRSPEFLAKLRQAAGEKKKPPA